MPRPTYPIFTDHKNKLPFWCRDLAGHHNGDLRILAQFLHEKRTRSRKGIAVVWADRYRFADVPHQYPL
jgi:hypothetical protein